MLVALVAPAPVVVVVVVAVGGAAWAFAFGEEAAQSRNSITTGFRLALPRDRRPLTEEDTEATEAPEDLMPRTRFLLLVLPAIRALVTEPGREATPLAWLCAAIIFAMAWECGDNDAAAPPPPAAAAAAMGSAGAMPCSVTTTPPGGMGGGAPGHMGWKRLVGGGPPTAPGSLRADADVTEATDAAPAMLLAAVPAVALGFDVTDAPRDGGRLPAE